MTVYAVKEFERKVESLGMFSYFYFQHILCADRAGQSSGGVSQGTSGQAGTDQSVGAYY